MYSGSYLFKLVIQTIQYMENAEKKKVVVKSTKNGRLYMETTDLLSQEKVQYTIHYLLDSDLIKDIDKRNKQKEQEAHH